MWQRPAVSLVLILASGALGCRSVTAPRVELVRTAQDDENDARFLQLQSWATAVREHEPGRFDPPAVLVNAWTEGDLRAVLAGLKAMVRFLIAAEESLEKSGVATTTTYLGRTLTTSEVQELLGLTDDEVHSADANRFFKGGALLHADIAMLAPSDYQTPVHTDPLQPRFFVYRDGRLQGVEFAAVHWTFGRALLDEVKPDPALDETVRLWYRAMGAYLQTGQAFAYADPLLADARRIFAADADILLYSGSMHEDYATPRSQAAAFETVVRPTREELRQAQAFFRQALKSSPGLTEARIRLGRVLELLGHAQEAAVDLQRAATETDSQVLRYYAELFLGQAEQALGHREAARDAFGRAAELYPRAQSPRFALSALARRFGDRVDALGAIQQVLALTGNERTREDPWWSYGSTHVPDADKLLDELYQPFLAAKAQ
jgi:tetratricopeptide (TPR) repeat protein